MNIKKWFAFSIIVLFIIPLVFAGIDENGTVTCPTGENDINNICHTIQGPAAGLGLLFQYLGTSSGRLLIVLAMVGLIAAIGFAIAFAIKKIVNH